MQIVAKARSPPKEPRSRLPNPRFDGADARLELTGAGFSERVDQPGFVGPGKNDQIPVTAAAFAGEFDMLDPTIGLVDLPGDPVAVFQRPDGAAHLGLVHGGMRPDLGGGDPLELSDRGQCPPFGPGQPVPLAVERGKLTADDLGRAGKPVGKKSFERQRVGVRLFRG